VRSETLPKPISTPALMSHQIEGVEFLLTHKSGLLAFEQGLGKTRVAIEAFARLQDDGVVDLMLVLCPNSLKRNWVAEIELYAPGTSTLIVEGPARARRESTAQASATVVIIGYESARKDITAVRALLTQRRGVLVLDESHYAKNTASLTATAAEYFASLSAYRWLLTGTPVTNSVADLYSQITIVANSRALGSLAAFTATYGGANGSARHAQLADRVKPYLLRRTKDECLDLPDKTFVDIRVELPAWQRSLYDAMRDDTIAEVEGMTADQFRAFAPTALTRLLRLSQLASNPRLLVKGEQRTPGKFGELDHLVDELVAENRKLIIWSYYVETIKTLVERYASAGSVAIYGGTPVGERQTIARRFQEDAATHVLIGNPAAAGTGFTLTAATYAIYETLSWRYDLYAQSQDRNHRIGQSLPVTYIRLLAADTIEPAIAEVLARKTKMARSLVGDEDLVPKVQEMTPAEFSQLIMTGILPRTIDRNY
jgi:SNF2 family DNA or RNA helicase